MNEFNGVVQRIFHKVWQGKTFYSFTLSGVDGFFNTGMKKPPGEGASVSFKAKQTPKGFLEVDFSTIAYQNDGEPTKAAIPSRAYPKAAASSSSREGYWEAKGERDIQNDKLREIGASRNTAIAILDLMIRHEAIKLPAVAKREEFLWEVIEKYKDKLMAKGESTDSAEPEAEPETGQEEDPEDWN